MENFRVCEHLGSACYYITIYYYNIILYSSKYMNEFTFGFIDPQQIAMHIPSVFIAYIDLGKVGRSEPNREMIADLATAAYLSLAPCPNLVVTTHTRGT